MNDFSITIKFDKRAICENEKYILLNKGLKLYIFDKSCNKEKYIGQFPASVVKRIISHFSFFRRLLRLEPRCGLFVDSDHALVSMHGAVYNISVVTGKIIAEHFFRAGMNNPLYFTEISGLKGFDDGVVYGEYIGGGNMENVNIMFRSKEGIWSTVYSFPQGSIKHIHNIIVSYERESLLVFSGDSDDESAIWEFVGGFSSPKKIFFGKQKYRACVAFPCKKGIVYASDAPDEQNFIYYWDGNTPDVEIIQPIDGPCIYGTMLQSEKMLLSTSVEQNSEIKGVRRWITTKRAKGLVDNCTHVYCGNYREGFQKIASFEKDGFPFLLFGYGAALFPNGHHGKVICTIQAIKKLDGKTIEIECSN